jgi:histidine ammonia-lyase
MRSVVLNGQNLRIDDVVSVAREKAFVSISEESKREVEKSSSLVDSWVSERKLVYGITTGVGPFLTNVISNSAMQSFQRNLILSHAAGAGAPLGSDAVRASMLARANALSKGFSGILLVTLETLIEMLNKGVHPCVPEYGAVGASGDLTPLAHIALVLIGEGKAEFEGKIMNGGDAMLEAGIKPLKLIRKEGLSLINGTSISTGIAALNVSDAENLLRMADITSALCLEALKGWIESFDEKIHNVKPHPGQIKSAENVRKILQGSKLIKKTLDLLEDERALLEKDCAYETDIKIQDAYTLRCSAQIIGACRDGVEFAKSIVEVELNSATDNPLVFSESKECLHGGNFHGQSVALAMDVLGLCMTELGILSERRTARLLDEKLSGGLPAFLVMKDKGLQSGLMAVQYLATELVAENRVLSSPASIGSISTNSNNEDVVSMAMVASRKAARIIRNVKNILAVELLCEAQAVDFFGPEKLGAGTGATYGLIRKEILPVIEDRPLNKDLEKIANLINDGVIVKSVEAVIGKLN